MSWRSRLRIRPKSLPCPKPPDQPAGVANHGQLLPSGWSAAVTTKAAFVAAAGTVCALPLVAGLSGRFRRPPRLPGCGVFEEVSRHGDGQQEARGSSAGRQPAAAGRGAERSQRPAGSGRVARTLCGGHRADRRRAGGRAGALGSAVGAGDRRGGPSAQRRYRQALFWDQCADPLGRGHRRGLSLPVLADLPSGARGRRRGPQGRARHVRGLCRPLHAARRAGRLCRPDRRCGAPRRELHRSAPGRPARPRARPTPRHRSRVRPRWSSASM